MSDQVQTTAWGFQSDNDDSLKTKLGGKFGLNEATISKFEYNPNAGKDESPADAIDISVKIGDKEFNQRVYDITGELFKGDNRIAPGEPGYNELFNAEKKQREALVIHTVKAFGVTEDQIRLALQNGNVTNFATWATAICNLKGPDFASKPVDVFLEYQWSIGENNTRTFLQLPRNMKGGRFLAPHIKPVGSWKEVKDENGLRYVDDAGNEHPFTKSKNFMDSPKANLQVEGETGPTSSNTSPDTSGSMAGTTAAKAKWS